MHQVIQIHVEAPPKPGRGEACNGCGVCCSSEPCPIGMLLSRRREGACAALQWSEKDRIYRCGLVESPQDYLPALLSTAAPWLGRFAHRMIASGAGCDCSLEVEEFDSLI